MKYLITGGCGFLGTNLSKEALARKDRLLVFDNLSRVGAADNLAWLRRQGQFEFVQGDVRMQEDVDHVVSTFKPDAVFHLAGQVAMTTSIADPRLDFEVNALGTFNVLDAVRRLSPESVVLYSSTNKVYGDLEWVRYKEDDTRYVAPDYPMGFPETIPLDFHSPYGTSKGAADQYVLDFSRIYGLRTAVFRHSTMYGGRQFATYDQGWVGWFCQQAIEIRRNKDRSPFTISGNGKQVRDVLHADDATALYFAAVEHMDQANGQAFNVGGGMKRSLSLLELFALLKDRLGVDMTYTQLPPRESDQKIFVADVGKAGNLLGWSPTVSAEDGVGSILKWLQDA